MEESRAEAYSVFSSAMAAATIIGNMVLLSFQQCYGSSNDHWQ